MEIVGTESLVPKDRLLRKIHAAVDFNKRSDRVEQLYCQDNGRPSVDPAFVWTQLSAPSFFSLFLQKLLTKAARLYIIIINS